MSAHIAIAQILRGFCQLGRSSGNDISFHTPPASEPLCGLTITCDAPLSSAQALEPMQALFGGGITIDSDSWLSRGLARFQKAHPEAEIVWRSLSPGVEYDCYLAWHLCPQSLTLKALEDPKKSPSIAAKTVYSSGMTLELCLQNSEPFDFLVEGGKDTVSYSDQAALSPELSAQVSRVLPYLPGRPLPSFQTLLGWALRLADREPDWKARAVYYQSYDGRQGRRLFSTLFSGEIAERFVVKGGRVTQAATPQAGQPEFAYFAPASQQAGLMTELRYNTSQTIKVPFDSGLTASPQQLVAAQEADLTAPARRRARGSWFERAVYRVDDSVPVLGLVSRRWAGLVRGIDSKHILAENSTEEWPRYLVCSRILFLAVQENRPSQIVFFEYGVALETMEVDLGIPGCLCLVDCEPVTVRCGVVVEDQAFEALVAELREQVAELKTQSERS